MRRGVIASIGPEDGLRSGRQSRQSRQSVGAWSPAPAVSTEPPGRLRRLEGRKVSVALRDGTRLSGCTLVSAGRSRAGTLWLVAGDVDTFVAVDEVDEIDEVDEVDEVDEAADPDVTRPRVG
jgi:hypothetical protein